MAVNVLLLLGISLSWASGYLFIDAADHGLPPITAAAIMSAIAALVLIPGVAIGLKRPLLQPLKKRFWVPLLMGFTAIAWPNLSVVLAEEQVAPELAALVGTTVPIITFLLTVFVTRQAAYSHRRLSGVFIAVAGMVVFIGWSQLLSNTSELRGILIMMSGGLVFALNGIIAAYVAKDLDECALAAWVVVFGAAILAIAAFALEAGQASRPPLEVMASVAAEGLLGMGIATLGYYVLLARAGAYFTSLYAFLVPLLGVLMSSLFLDEPLSAQHLIGLAVVLVGLRLLSSRAEPRHADSAKSD